MATRRTCADLLVERAHPADRERITAELARIEREPRDWTTDYRISLPDGTHRHVQLQIRAVGKELSGAIVDVTETKQLEASLDASRHYYAVLLASIADGVIVTDEADRITFMNRAAEDLTGWSHTTALGQAYGTVVERERDLDEQRSSLADERGAVTVLRRATERRNAARANSAALVNERIGRALRGSGVGIWWMQLSGSEFSTEAPGIHTINLWESLGWSTADDVITDGIRQAHSDRIHPEDRALLLDAFRAHARGETPNIEIVTRVRHVDGKWRHILTRGMRVGDRLTGSLIDITSRHQLEADIRNARDAAEAANRAKDEFLANVSHEVRTPMNAILGMTELALSTTLSAEQRPWLTTVKSSADNLLVIIDELLDFSKAEANKLELAALPFAIRELVADTLRSLSVRAQRKQIALVSQVADDVPEMVIGDRTRLHQILTNLVGNAIKFTSIGEIRVTVTMCGPELVLAVQDTGIGIPADKHALIFEPFTQADASTTRRFGGTGLGLTIASRLASLMGGGIDVASAPDLGSTFTVRVRLAPVPEHEVARLRQVDAPREVSEQRSGRSLKILVGEDNGFNADLVRELLIRRGHTVAVAIEGHTTLARALSETFDILLLDIHMPGIDGFDVIRAIRERERETGGHLPVVALTARSRREDREKCLAAGMDDFLSKPLQSKLMFEIVERLTHST
ncbi:MAG: ATP-binding protein [Kofleriaceae bacterium]